MTADVHETTPMSGASMGSDESAREDAVLARGRALPGWGSDQRQELRGGP